MQRGGVLVCLHWRQKTGSRAGHTGWGRGGGKGRDLRNEGRHLWRGAGAGAVRGEAKASMQRDAVANADQGPSIIQGPLRFQAGGPRPSFLGAQPSIRNHLEGIETWHQGKMKQVRSSFHAYVAGKGMQDNGLIHAAGQGGVTGHPKTSEEAF